jgi:capsular polysaccharide biosynthesis protein
MLKTIIQILLRKKLLISIVAIIGLGLGLGFSYLQTPQYEASVGLIILPHSSEGLDAYSAIKTSERIGENLIGVLQTSSIFEKLKNPEYQIDFSFFDVTNSTKLKEQWGKTVSAYMKYNSGLLYINVYHQNSDQAKLIAKSLAQILISNGNEYVAQDGLVDIRLIDDAIVSEKTVKPNYLMNALLGLISFAILAKIYALFSSKEFINLFSNNQN